MKQNHALFSPSSGHRWTKCPFSVMGEQLPSKSSVFAMEGTRAHKVAEKILNGDSDVVDLCKNYKNQVDLSMLDYINFYISTLRESGPYDSVQIEKKLTICGDDLWGTADFIGIKGNVVHVFDLKYGKTPVDAKESVQLDIYAVGAWLLYGREVVKHIVQPRVEEYKHTSGVLYKDVLNMAYEMLCSAIVWVKENPGHKEPGGWCLWCRAVCKHNIKKGM